MKKIIILMLICFCFLFAGCSSGGAGLVLNTNGSVTEYYFVPIPEKALLRNGVSDEQITTIINNAIDFVQKDDLFIEDDGIFPNFIINYRNNVNKSDAYTQKQKEQLLNGVTTGADIISENNFRVGIRFYFNFANSTCYNLFKNINENIKEERRVEKIDNFFTTTTKVIKDPIFDIITSKALTIGQKCLQIANQQIIKVVGVSLWNEIKQSVNYDVTSSMFDYTYVVPTARVHTNANSIAKDGNGYYYHTWHINLNNLDENKNSIMKIEYWTTTANKWIWYVITLAIGAGVIGSIYFIGKNKENKESKKFKVEYKDGGN